MPLKKIEIKPLITEKSMKAVSRNVYTFLVPKKLGRKVISQILKEIYKVTPLSVNTAIFKGKIKTFKRFKGQRPDFKKALVQLKAGEKIPGFEIEKPKEKTEDKTSKSKVVEKKAKNG